MVRGYTFSKEGQESYAKVGLSYDRELQDNLYDDWVRTTTAEGLSNYTKHKEKELQQIQVIRVANSDYTGENEGEGSEMYKYFVTFSWIHRRLDPACNVTSRTVAGCGKFPIPEAHYKIENQDFGKQKRTADFAQNITTGYSIPWTTANIKKILKEHSLPVNSKLQCSVSTENNVRFHVESIQDLMNGTPFDELLHFGRTPTKFEREQWLSKLGGAPEDNRRIVELARRRTEGEMQQQRPITASEVQEMLDRDRKQKDS